MASDIDTPPFTYFVSMLLVVALIPFGAFFLVSFLPLSLLLDMEGVGLIIGPDTVMRLFADWQGYVGSFFRYVCMAASLSFLLIAFTLLKDGQVSFQQRVLFSGRKKWLFRNRAWRKYAISAVLVLLATGSIFAASEMAWQKIPNLFTPPDVNSDSARDFMIDFFIRAAWIDVLEHFDIRLTHLEFNRPSISIYASVEHWAFASTLFCVRNLLTIYFGYLIASGAVILLPWAMAVEGRRLGCKGAIRAHNWIMSARRSRRASVR
jgi:hypothetical protein